MIKWTITQLIAAGSLGVLMTLISIPGSLIAVAVGIPGAGVVLNGIVLPLFAVFSMLLIRNFGTAAIVGGIGMLIVLPVPVIGPAGFFPKVFLGFMLGLLYDLLFSFFRRFGKWGAVIVTPIIILVSDAVIGAVLLLFKAPTMLAYYSKLSLAMVAVFNAVFIIEGIAASLFAWHAFQKLKNTAVVRRIQSNAA